MSSIIRSARKALKLPLVRGLSPFGKALVALGTYATWTAITWLLEGRIQTLLRPEAVTDRLVPVLGLLTTRGRTCVTTPLILVTQE